jgi:predicted lipoprotein
MTSRLFAVAGSLAVVIAATVACKPWTVRPIEEQGATTQSAARAFDAKVFADSVWASQVVPLARHTTVVPGGANTPPDAGGGTAVFVKVTGTVTDIDMHSRVGTVSIDLVPGDGRPDVSLQIGPVLRGTALRDALPFIRFGDFANQIEFAEVSNALNARVLADVLGHFDAAAMKGRILTVYGAMSPAGRTKLPEIVPVVIEPGTRP